NRRLAHPSRPLEHNVKLLLITLEIRHRPIHSKRAPHVLDDPQLILRLHPFRRRHPRHVARARRRRAKPVLVIHREPADRDKQHQPQRSKRQVNVDGPRPRHKSSIHRHKSLPAPITSPPAHIPPATPPTPPSPSSPSRLSCPYKRP